MFQKHGLCMEFHQEEHVLCALFIWILEGKVWLSHCFKPIQQSVLTIIQDLLDLIYFNNLFISVDDDQEGVMDNLLEALKTGSAFNVNRERKDGRKRTPRVAGGKCEGCMEQFTIQMVYILQMG